MHMFKVREHPQAEVCCTNVLGEACIVPPIARNETDSERN